ncbi:DUF3105 domain-containing protein [Pendulispora rubella]|uniref:DUF3105 domain-containing protein n=1 Tax=Pendulispora rubella TaxID=2741070 RepID=A0ABZ2L1X7_9BACT
MRRPSRWLRGLVVLASTAVFAPLAVVACGDDDKSAPNTPGGDGGVPADALVDSTTRYVVPDAACEIVIDQYPLLASPHVEKSVEIAYNSNPPSSGPHDQKWAAFQEFTDPVPRRNYVHDLEHGAVAFLYRCDLPGAGDCNAITELFRSTVSSQPNDPICANETKRVRTVITPDPLLDFPIAASAWGWTYRARCIDPASLADFVRDHYGKGPEVLCAPGVDHF